MSLPRRLRPLVPALGAALAVALAVPHAPATAGTADRTATAPPELAGLTAPEGGPVDDGWLEVPPGSTFTQFDGEPAPAGSPIWPGVRHDIRRTAVGQGLGVDVQIVHLDPGAPVTIQPTHANGTVRGTAPVAVQSGDPLLGSVAAINGGFWLGKPYGEPNGFFARDGRLISDAETQGAGPRGTVGWTADGRLLVDRIDTTETVTLPDGTTVPLNGINRGHRDEGEQFYDGTHSLLAYTADYGGTVTVTHPVPLTPPPPTEPPVDLAVVRVAVPHWPVTGSLTGTVTAIQRDEPGVFTPRPGEVLLAGTGSGATALDGLAVGDAVTVATRISARSSDRDDDWAQVVRGLASGPMIVEGGQVTDPGGWVDEGFEPHVHSNVRAPRSAIGVTADGRTLLVAADGRRPGITHGFTIAELARYMIALGAVEALSLDGGASSQLVVDGIMRNDPCCDAVTRSVATSLQVTHAEPFDGTHRLRGAGRVDTAAAVARHAFGGGARTAVLAVADAFPDALAGGPLAAVLGGPLLLTARDAVPDVTAQALDDLGVERVVLLGGPAVIGGGVVDDLTARGIVAQRVAGQSRFDTAAAIADSLDGVVSAVPGRGVSRAFLASAGSFADALVAAGPGGMLDMPILLTEPDRLHPASAAVLAELDEVVVVGGTSRISADVVDEVEDLGVAVTRLSGTGRFGTAAAVNAWLATHADLSDGLVVATGADFPDALAGGPLAAVRRAPLMIVPGGDITADPDAAAFFAALPARGDIDVLGGLGVVSSYQQWQLEQLGQ